MGELRGLSKWRSRFQGIGLDKALIDNATEKAGTLLVQVERFMGVLSSAVQQVCSFTVLFSYRNCNLLRETRSHRPCPLRACLCIWLHPLGFVILSLILDHSCSSQISLAGSWSLWRHWCQNRVINFYRSVGLAFVNFSKNIFLIASFWKCSCSLLHGFCSELVIIFLKFLYDQDPIEQLLDFSNVDRKIEVDR